jgi:unsaturated chondroitin disaccharide hydrolase
MKRSCLIVPAMVLEMLEPRALLSAVPTVGMPAAASQPTMLAEATTNQSQLQAEIKNAWNFALTQLSNTLSTLHVSGAFPSYTKPGGAWHDVPASDWTSGFFAGELWEAYKQSGSAAMKKAAERLTAQLTPQTAAKDDLAFRFLPTDGLEYQLTNDAVAKKVLIDAAASKISTFDANVGMFRSVDGRASTSGNPLADFPVLMDHTMDIELVYRAASLAGRSDWIKMADEHMEKLETTLVRPDGSTYQWGYFNEKTGKFIDGETRQGLNSGSTWSRGQAWAMYSFTAAAELRGRPDFLATAEKTANFFLDHLPADGIPYWDFSAPITPTTPRDSSAAAIAADALLRLAKLIPGTAEATRYEGAAENILATLASPAYLVQGTTSSGILLHGARWVAKGETNESLSFGDYYFLDAMNRFEGLI